MADDEGKQPEGPPRFGYAGDPAGPGYEFWREEFCRQVMAADLDPISSGPFQCAVTATPIPLANLSHAETSPMKWTSMGMNTHLVLLMSPNSPMHAAMGRRSLDVPASGVSLGDASIKGAYVSVLSEGHFKTALIDRKTLLERCPRAEDAVARPLAQDPALALLLYQYYDLIAKHAGGLDALAQSAVAQHLLDLVVLAIGTGRDETEQARERGLAAARFEAIKADILSRLGNGALSLGDIAKRHRASPRYVQMLFERAGTSFSEFVLEQRLLLAHRLLTSPLNSARKVSDIAHMAGFGDVSYFHRAFRKRFGATPADVRAAR